MSTPTDRRPVGARLLIAACALLAVGAGAAAEARESKAPVELALQEEPLGDVVEAIAARTGDDYVFEPPLPGRVTVAVPARVSVEEARQILDAALLIKGFTALPIAPGRFKIVRWDKLASEAPYREEEPSAEKESGITTRISLRYANPDEVARTLRPMVPSSAQVVAYPPAASLILAGSENVVRRLIEIAQDLDSARHNELMVRRIRYAAASEVHKQLEAMTQRLASSESPIPEVSIQSDDRTNSLIVSGAPDELAKIRDWIDAIDIPVRGEGTIQVVPVFHQDPKEFADLLNAQATGGTRGNPGTGNADESVEPGTLVGRDYEVVAHEATHSLVIRADLGTFEVLRQLIAKLDREPRVVEVEVGFYELTTDGQLAFGAGGVIPAIKPKEQDDTALVFLPNAQLSPNAIPGVTEANPAIAALGAPLFQISGESVVIPVLDSSGNPVFDSSGQPQVVLVPGLGISLLSQQTHAQIEVTNRPSLTVAVGEESEIFVGDEVPVPVANTNVADLVNLGPSLRVDIQREDVGTKLRLKPAYNEGGDLRVDVALDLSLVRSAGDIQSGPVLANRHLETSIRVGFDQRAIIAGLESETKGKVRSGVPFLSAIPLLGHLFTAELETVRRTYSLISLTATLLPTLEERQARQEALARAVAARAKEFGSLTGSRYALRAASYYTEEMAQAALRDIGLEDKKTAILRRESELGERFDLYVLGIDEIGDLATTALDLEAAGLRPEIIPLADAQTAVR